MALSSETIVQKVRYRLDCIAQPITSLARGAHEGVEFLSKRPKIGIPVLLGTAGVGGFGLGEAALLAGHPTITTTLDVLKIAASFGGATLVIIIGVASRRYHERIHR